jgi:hypothetical protein
VQAQQRQTSGVTNPETAMSKGTIIFYKCVQNSHNLGSNEQYSVSRLCFMIQIDNKKYENLYVDVMQETSADPVSGPLKVGMPQGSPKILDYSVFQPAAEQYYRACCKNSFGRDNTVTRIMMFNIDI